MSQLSKLAAAAAEFLAGKRRQPPTGPDGSPIAGKLLADLASLFRRSKQQRPKGPPRSPQPPGEWMLSSEGPPPILPPRKPPAPPGDDGDDDDDEESQIPTSGRGYHTDSEDWQIVQRGMRYVDSTNVYGYYFQRETPSMGILFVQFLAWTPKQFGGTGERSGPGPTYAYYDFPMAKYREFERMAASTAGGAVWDYCRVRMSKFEHQHTYQLVQVSGDYVPRKATAKGYKARQVADIGVGRRGAHARQQLPSQDIAFRRVLPARNYAAMPNRAGPNRGEPNRG